MCSTRTLALAAEYALLLLLSCAALYLARHDRSAEHGVRVSVLSASARPPPGRAVLGSTIHGSSAQPLPPPASAPRAAISSPAPSSSLQQLSSAPSSSPSSGLKRWHLPAPKKSEAELAASSPGLPPCLEVSAWDDSHFSADQDWVLSTNGKKAERDTLWHHDPCSKRGRSLADRSQLTPQDGSHGTATEHPLCVRVLDMGISGGAGAFRSVWSDWWCKEVREMLYLTIDE